MTDKAKEAEHDEQVKHEIEDQSVEHNATLDRAKKALGILDELARVERAAERRMHR